MTGFHQLMPPVAGLVDAEGRLAQADEQLAELNERAGGTLGEALAVPQIATVAGLARRLRIVVSRGVTVADGDDDVELWVRAEPVDGAVRLAITGWTLREPWRPALRAQPAGPAARGDADWLWETDAAFRLTFLSPDVALRYGVDADALLGQPVARLFGFAETDDGNFPLLGALASREAFAGQRAALRGTGRDVSLDATPRTDAEGNFAGFAGAAHMIETRAPEAPVDAEGKLPDAFSARLDKALRAPLARIVANADSIHAAADGPLRPEYADYASDIATAGRHLMGLVDDLVDLQAVERADFEAAREDIDLADVARRAAGLLQVRAASGNVRIDKPAPDETLPATGEFRRALQVLVNLVGNAVRYSPEGGMVWIRATSERGVAAIIVADQGKGIALADQARIFEKFERVDPSEPGGTGLGLYIARRLARAMGGDIAVDSAPGQGARFIFTLPGR